MLVAIAVAVSVSGSATAAPARLPWRDAAPQPQYLDGPFAEAVMRPVVVSLPGMDRVRYIRDLDYRGGGDPLARMDLYLPPVPDGRRPVVLFLHGGADIRTQPKDWGIYQSWGRLAAASGMAGITFTQHLGFPRTNIGQAADDVRAALAYVRANADRYGLDPDRVCLVAFSAGGPMLAPYMADAPPGVRCLVGYYPFMDIRQSDVHRQSESAETRDAFSNILKVSGPGRKTPLYLVRAGADEIPTLKDSIDRFVAAALAADYPLTVANNPGAPHGFDNKVDDQRTREIILETLQFLRGRLGPGQAVEGGVQSSAGGGRTERGSM